MNVLLIDDEIMVTQLLIKHIPWKGLGISEVYAAYNCQEARKIVQSKKIGLVICDIEMPQESGLSFLTWQKDFYPDIESIILTAYPNFTYAQSAVSLGVKRYLLKPISFDELTETIRAITYLLPKEEENNIVTKPDVVNQPVSIQENNSHIAEDAIQYIQNHYREDISRCDVATALHINGDYLNRVFKQATGLSIVQYLQYYRILVAKRLLRERKLRITDVYSYVGYENHSYFAKVFRKWVGTSPNEYVRESKE